MPPRELRPAPHQMLNCKNPLVERRKEMEDQVLRKFSLIGVGSASLFLPLPALADSASKVAPLTPVVSTCPTAMVSVSFTPIPVANTFIAVTVARFTLIPVASTFIRVGQARRVDPSIRTGVRSWHKADAPSAPAQGQLLTDAVDKVGDEQRAGNNRIQVPSSLNQSCAPDSYLETMLLTRPSKNV